VGLFVALASAQNATNDDYNRERTVLRLNADLGNLKTVPADVRVVVLSRCIAERGTTTQRPQECGAADQITDDLVLTKDSQRRSPADGLGLQLISALSGRELEPGALLALTNSVVDMVAIADQSIAAQKAVLASRPFQESTNRARSALVALGVPTRRAELLLVNFAQNAENRTHPRPHLLEPIPPAFRSPYLDTIPPPTR
jgi:hypothetical protein